MIQVDLVIPTYNGREHLSNCLNAVRGQTWSDVNVIVVDDGSTDGTEQVMASDFPEFTYLRLPGNRGFAAACNSGINSGTSEFVALLNNDAIPEPAWLANLLAGIQRHPGAAAVASKILLADGSGRLHAAGDTFSWNGMPNSRGVWELDRGQYEAEEEVFSASAAAALYRRAVLDQVTITGGQVFDTDFFMYCEDIDLGWRLRLLGYKIIYIPDARVTHHLSATGGGPLASYYVARNSFAVLAKNLPPALRRQIWPRFIIRQVEQFLEALSHIREPAARARMRGILAGPMFAFKLRDKHRQLQPARQASDCNLKRLLTE